MKTYMVREIGPRNPPSGHENIIFDVEVYDEDRLVKSAQLHGYTEKMGWVVVDTLPIIAESPEAAIGTYLKGKSAARAAGISFGQMLHGETN